VAIALLAALVVMPPLMVWADERGLLGTGEQISARSVRLAARMPGPQTALAAVGVVAFGAGAILTYSLADTTTGAAVDVSYSPVALTTTTTTTVAIEISDDDAPAPTVDPSGFPETRPEGTVAGILFDALTEVGEAPNVANCTVETLFERVDEAELLALGLPAFTPASLEPVITAATDCGIGPARIDAAIAAARVIVTGG